MTSYELSTLKHFHPGEPLVNGEPIVWATIDYKTMVVVDRIREDFGPGKGNEIFLVQGAHGYNAVDWTAPGVPYSRVMAEVMRTPGSSYGFYSGGSVHLDMRVHESAPARWLAVKPEQRGLLLYEGLLPLITGETDEWIYLKWSSAKLLTAMNLVAKLADLQLGNQA